VPYARPSLARPLARRPHPSAPIAAPSPAARAIVTIAAVALAASYVLTWELWQGRVEPPNLPALGSSSAWSFGAPLVAAALASIGFPRLGSTVHGSLLVIAILGDQVREQPELISLAILLAAGAWGPKGGEIGRWHMVTMWAWAGIHKALSLGWATGSAAVIADAFGASGLRGVVAVAVPASEIALAALALRRRAWPVLRVAAPVFHLGVVLFLVLDGDNLAVLPWNLALVAIAPLLFRPPDRAAGPGASRGTVAVAAFLAIHPAGFYLGVTDTYLAHNLYTSNEAGASMCVAGGDCFDPFATRASLDVPLPPERRLYVAWFERICRPGDTLRIDGIDTRLVHGQVDVVACPLNP
jgi:hypothetical protein